MSDEKRKQLQARVNSKIHWGASDEEVLEWLLEEHGLAGAQADCVLNEARRELRQEVRTRALLGMIGSGVALAFVGTIIGMQIATGRFVIGVPVIFFLGFGLASLAFFIRSLSRFVSGNYLGPMDS